MAGLFITQPLVHRHGGRAAIQRVQATNLHLHRRLYLSPITGPGLPSHQRTDAGSIQKVLSRLDRRVKVFGLRGGFNHRGEDGIDSRAQSLLRLSAYLAQLSAVPDADGTARNALALAGEAGPRAVGGA